MMEKRGITPIIATVILVAVVVVLGTVSFLWFKGFVKEEGTKFGKSLPLVCEQDVQFEADYSSGILDLRNSGNALIFRMKVKKFQSGAYTTEELKGTADTPWPAAGLKTGESFSQGLALTGAERALAIPVLIGKSGKGDKTYTCGDQYGEEIPV